MSPHCPISQEKADHSATRIAAFFVFVAALVAAFAPAPWLAILLTIDFAIRGFTKSRISPIDYLSRTAVTLLRIKSQPIDAAPKRFAAKLGTLMAAALAITQLLGVAYAPQAVAVLLAACAGLEAGIGFCVGCQIYALVVRRPTMAGTPIGEES
ncbi:MAG: DUF4395 domain-containing protein [Myxococcales bacterium]|nr:MAG: DUF4395 domain-containing protein [Myxococcales bacterium]